MNNESFVETFVNGGIINTDDRKFDKAMTSLQMAGWVQTLCPWQVFATFTWRDRIFYYRDGTPKACGVKQHTAQRYYERFMAKEFPRLSYFYAVEENPSRDGHHIHAMFGDAKGLYRKEMWEGWFHRFGRATIEPVRGKADVADYCAKYVCKNDVWWNVKLQWHRQQKLHNRDFVLRPEEGLPTGWDCTSSV